MDSFGAVRSTRTGVGSTEITLGRACDIDSWIELAEQIKDDFPGPGTGKAMKEHRNTVFTFRIGKWQKAVKAEKGPLAFPDKIV